MQDKPRIIRICLPMWEKLSFIFYVCCNALKATLLRKYKNRFSVSVFPRSFRIFDQRKTRWAQTNLPRLKKEKIEEVHGRSKARKLLAALIISFQEPFDIQEFPTGNSVSKRKALILCRLSGVPRTGCCQVNLLWKQQWMDAVSAVLLDMPVQSSSALQVSAKSSLVILFYFQHHLNQSVI